jgi:hypothetical protein
MSALYLLAGEYRAAADKLADMDLDPQTLADTLESLTGDLEVKAVNVGMLVRNMEATAAAIKEAEAGMAARRKAIENRADGIRRYILSCMQGAGVNKLETAHLALSIRANPPAVDVFDAAQVPAAFMRVPDPPPPVPDKTAIKDALKRGEDVPGARLMQGQRLEIKA